MTDQIFTAILVGLCAMGGGLMLLTLLVVGFSTDAKAVRHPQGRMGLVKDNLLLIAPMIAPLTMLALGELTTLDNGAAWLWMWGAVLVGILVWSFAPAQRRARARLTTAHRYPPQ
ncbi:hypothetical protein [Brevundimonas sp. NIBR11]|uniref:hypothetical protein n=1 Tax=Brevundimonas sp. NIBR11 TaxID=3015999 RepID=UPI0022F09E9E|nr:hypothetical protein [Brevundimonas sp. NIBR11]WGM31424.1 hypothetical protein KKHFBJBL_01668 [Brevundimonas sp. NIBR11]